MLKSIIHHLAQKKTLSKNEISYCVEASKEGTLGPSQQAAILSGLQVKGIHPKEIAAFVKILEKHISMPISFPHAIDICGTGGSGLMRINTSTISAFIASALEVHIAKHGNKAASGRFGSFDLLEKMGITFHLSQRHLKYLAEDFHLNFLFARNFHPIMKHFATVRSELPFPTIFNLLGPLLNPAHVDRQIIGTSSRQNALLLIEAAKILKRKEVLIIAGEDGLDEVTLTGKTYCYHLRDTTIKTFILRPSSFGISKAEFSEIEGGDSSRNTQIAMEILQGKCQTRHQDLVLINAALAISFAGKAKNLKKAYILAKNAIESGKVYAHFLAYKKACEYSENFYSMLQEKKKEIEKRKKIISLRKLQNALFPKTRDFAKALKGKKLSLIAEIKKASPAEGILRKAAFHPSSIAKSYEEAGAAAISVLADQKFFRGHPSYVRIAKESTLFTPILWKDFVIDEYQIHEARYFGADAILLIARILPLPKLQQFFELAKKIGLQVILEVHTEEDLKEAKILGAEMIGINHRDLYSFEIDKRRTHALLKKIQKNTIIISESGFKTKSDLKKIPKGVSAVLMGTVLMKSKNPKKTIESFFGKRKPILKICGIRSVPEALFCVQRGVDLMGLNFVPSSHRKISYQLASSIMQALKKSPGKTKIVGVFQDQDEDEIFTASKKLGLDYLQFSGKEPLHVIKKSPVPVIKSISVKNKSDLKKATRYLPHCAFLLLDSKRPGSGESFDHRMLRTFKTPFLLAGGINSDNAKGILRKIHPLGVDIASGIETDGEVDLKKIELLSHIIRS